MDDNFILSPELEWLVRHSPNPRDTLDLGTALQVGWDRTEILPSDSKRNIIYTLSVSCCFVLVGRDDENNIVMGHYNPTVGLKRGFENIGNRFRKHKPETDLSKLRLKIIYGPEYHYFLQKPNYDENNGYYHVFCRRDDDEILVYHKR